MAGEGWTVAERLKVGSPLLTKEGEVIRVESIERREGSFKVYNFEVEQLHTYFVSDLGVLAHNNNEICKSGADDAAKALAEARKGKWIEIHEAGKKLANDLLNEAKQEGVGAGTRSGQHGRPYTLAAARLRELLKQNANNWLPEFKEVIESKIVEYVNKAKGISHK